MNKNLILITLFSIYVCIFHYRIYETMTFYNENSYFSGINGSGSKCIQKNKKKNINRICTHFDSESRESGEKKNENHSKTKRPRTHLNNCLVLRLQMKQRGARKKRIKIRKYIWIE